MQSRVHLRCPGNCCHAVRGSARDGHSSVPIARAESLVDAIRDSTGPADDHTLGNLSNPAVTT